MIKVYSRKEYVDEIGLPIVRVRVLGLPIYTMKSSAGWIKHKYLLGIFKIREKGWTKEYYILGIKIFNCEDKYKKLEILNNQILRKLEENNKKTENKLNSMHRECINKIQTAALVASQHSKVFPQFKNKHKGEVGVLVATAPTMLHYEPIPNAVHFGVNRAFQNEKISLDYWFAIDILPIKAYIDDIKKQKFKKFVGQVYQTFPYGYYRENSGHISNYVIDEIGDCYKYFVEQNNLNNINIDIETQMLPDLGSCVFGAAYFSLYSGVKKLYIVGCDASPTGYFYEGAQEINSYLLQLPKAWAKFKEYARVFYPDVEIISVNPVGLKGLFRDVYTESYLEEHPKIREELGNDIEILDTNKREY